MSNNLVLKFWISKMGFLLFKTQEVLGGINHVSKEYRP